MASMSEVWELTKDGGDDRFQWDVLVRSPRRCGLARVLSAMGATVLAEPGGGLLVAGLHSWKIAASAAAHHIPIQELTVRRGAPARCEGLAFDSPEAARLGSRGPGLITWKGK
jgi:ABC-2 type transport system ATP-binding protein